MWDWIITNKEMDLLICQITHYGGKKCIASKIPTYWHEPRCSMSYWIAYIHTECYKHPLLAINKLKPYGKGKKF